MLFPGPPIVSPTFPNDYRTEPVMDSRRTGHRSIQHAESVRSNSFAVISVSASDFLAGLGLNSCARHTAAILLRALFDCVSGARPGFRLPRQDFWVYREIQ